MGELAFKWFPSGKIKVTYTGTMIDEKLMMSGVKYRLLTLKTSGTLMLSKAVTADLCGVGGGGTGSIGTNIAGGGQGGQVTNIMKQKIKNIHITVGAGGAEVSKKYNSYSGDINGNVGGNTTIRDLISDTDLLTARGGKPGTHSSYEHHDSVIYHGIGGGTSGEQSLGASCAVWGFADVQTVREATGNTVHAFEDADGALYGGGGGYAAMYCFCRAQYGYSTGGTPNGTKGVWENESNAKSQDAGIGGGTGGAVSGSDSAKFDYVSVTSGKGGDGIVQIRWPI